MAADQVKWTAKLPALAAGLLLWMGSLWLVFYRRSRVGALAALVLFLAGGGFIGYSLTIKEWCVVNEQSAFSSAFSPSLRGCLRMKGWLEP